MLPASMTLAALSAFSMLPVNTPAWRPYWVLFATSNASSMSWILIIGATGPKVSSLTIFISGLTWSITVGE